MKVYNSTSPVKAVKVAVVSIIDDCAPPQIKYPVKCGILLAQVGLAASLGLLRWQLVQLGKLLSNSKTKRKTCKNQSLSLILNLLSKVLKPVYCLLLLKVIKSHS